MFKSELSSDGVAFGDGRSDPLDILLQTISSSESSSDSSPADSPPDWSQYANWAPHDNKSELNSEFNFSLPMDLDFDSNMAVDPSALHFNPSMFAPHALPEVYPVNSSAFTAGDFVSASMFPFESPTPTNNNWSSTGRRLSVTSSSSSSGASLSPVISNHGHSDGGSSPNPVFSDPASELAQRVRQMSGVTLAVPVSAQVQQLAAAGGQTKLPIPRLPRQTPPVQPKRESPKPSPTAESISIPSPSVSPSPEQSDPSSSSTPEPASSSSSNAPPQPRPKTSHTTIERRYRTNLNARITGLKQAVPALRVLEAKAGMPNPYNDVVDSRGFVDGVKVARKMSKANILGKATEYIRVLKKREARLKREQDGLKALVSGLVGGPALLKEWEREWRERFGGEERDEVEDESLAAASDDEDGDGEDSEGEVDEEGRMRKKPKVAKASKEKKLAKPTSTPMAPTAPGAVPEKRKRGRPRKNPLPPTPAVPAASTPMFEHPIQPMPAPAPHAAPPLQTQQAPGQPTQQYLLAVFAFFSVFNSPITASFKSNPSHHHTHHGVVLTNNPVAAHPQPSPIVQPYDGYTTHELIQAFHLFVSTLVLFYVVVPWVSGAVSQGKGAALLSRASSYFFRVHSEGPVEDNDSNDLVPAAPVPTFVTLKSGPPNTAALKAALDPSRRGSQDEATQLRKCLGVSTGFVGMMQGVIKAGRTDRGIELNQLEQRAWVRLGELVAFDGTTPRLTRLQTYWCMSCHISTFSASTTDLTTLALIIRPVSLSKATALWEQARQRVVRPYERIVLSNMTVDEAAEWLEKWRSWHVTERKGRCAACEKRTPLGVLAAILIRERLRKHAASMFIRTVIPPRPEECDGDDRVYDAEKEYKEEQDRCETIEAGRSIGGRTAELAILLERIWQTGFFSHEDLYPYTRPALRQTPDEDVDCEDEHDLASTDEAEIRSLLSATLIYRRIFPSSFPNCAPSVSVILSPPPSPSRKNVALHTALRTALGNPAFDDPAGRLNEETSIALEDARDRVVDMLVELERAGRRNGVY
ncbi:hypothetical protein K474DRAFT_1598928 [Panus rudis PR-1116 ss-1]|nr:hypothetical protein K474DRAFT_1598928 [Panus rudis PR-1116 ss-1]